jgi:ribosomal protein L31E
VDIIKKLIKVNEYFWFAQRKTNGSLVQRDPEFAMTVWHRAMDMLDQTPSNVRTKVVQEIIKENKRNNTTLAVDIINRYT